MPVIYSQCDNCASRLRFNVERETGIVRVKCPKCQSIKAIQIEESLQDDFAPSDQNIENRPKPQSAGGSRPTVADSRPSKTNSGSPVRPKTNPVPVQSLEPSPSYPSYPSNSSYPIQQPGYSPPGQGGWDIPPPTFKPKEYEFDWRFVTYPLAALVCLGLLFGVYFGVTRLANYLGVSHYLTATLGGNPANAVTIRARDLTKELDNKLAEVPINSRSTEGATLVSSYIPKMRAIYRESLNLPGSTMRIDPLVKSVEKAFEKFQKDGIPPDADSMLGDVADVEINIDRYKAGNTSEFDKLVSEYHEMYAFTIALNRGGRLLEDPMAYRGKAIDISLTSRRRLGCEWLESRFLQATTVAILKMIENDSISEQELVKIGQILDKTATEAQSRLQSLASNSSSSSEQDGGMFHGRIYGIYSSQVTMWRGAARGALLKLDLKLVDQPEDLRVKNIFLRDQIQKMCSALGGASFQHMQELSEVANSTYLSRLEKHLSANSSAAPN